MSGREFFWLFVGLVVGALLVGSEAEAAVNYGGYPTVHVPSGTYWTADQYANYTAWVNQNGGAAALQQKYASQIGAEASAVRFPVTITAQRVITGAGIAAIARGLAKLAGPVGVGLTLAEIVWNASTQSYTHDGTSNGASGNPQQSAPILNGPYSYTTDIQHVSGDPAALCTGTQTFVADGTGPGANGGIAGAMTQTVYETSPYNFGAGSAGHCRNTAGGLTNIAYRPYCPTPSTKGTYGCAWPTACPAGTGRVSDGSCSGAANSPVTDAELDAKIAAAINTQNAAASVAQKLEQNGQASDLEGALGAPTLTTVPVSPVQGDTSTSTKTDASGNTVTNTSTQYNITQTTNTWNINATTTTVQTTTPPSGPATTTTTTSGTPATNGTPQAPQVVTCGSLSCESTQVAVKADTAAIKQTTADTLIELKAASAPTLPDQQAVIQTQKDLDVQKQADIPNDIKASKTSDMAMVFSWLWSPPGGSCVAPVASLSRVTISFNYCPMVDNIRAILGWLFAIFGALDIYGQLFRRTA